MRRRVYPRIASMERDGPQVAARDCGAASEFIGASFSGYALRARDRPRSGQHAASFCLTSARKACRMTPPRSQSARMKKFNVGGCRLRLGGHGAHPAINATHAPMVTAVCSSRRSIRRNSAASMAVASQPTKISNAMLANLNSRGLDLQLSESTAEQVIKRAAGKHLIIEKRSVFRSATCARCRPRSRQQKSKPACASSAAFSQFLVTKSVI